MLWVFLLFLNLDGLLQQAQVMRGTEFFFALSNTVSIFFFCAIRIQITYFK